MYNDRIQWSRQPNQQKEKDSIFEQNRSIRHSQQHHKGFKQTFFSICHHRKLWGSNKILEVMSVILIRTKKVMVDMVQMIIRKLNNNSKCVRKSIASNVRCNKDDSWLWLIKNAGSPCLPCPCRCPCLCLSVYVYISTHVYIIY